TVSLIMERSSATMERISGGKSAVSVWMDDSKGSRVDFVMIVTLEKMHQTRWLLMINRAHFNSQQNSLLCVHSMSKPTVDGPILSQINSSDSHLRGDCHF